MPTFFCGDKGVTWALPYKPLVPWGLMETAHSRGLWVAEPKDTEKDSSVFRGWLLPLGTKHICQNFEVERKTTSSAPKANPCSLLLCATQPSSRPRSMAVLPPLCQGSNLNDQETSTCQSFSTISWSKGEYFYSICINLQE